MLALGADQRTRLDETIHLVLQRSYRAQVEVLAVLRDLRLSHLAKPEVRASQPAGSTQARSLLLSSSTFDPSAVAQNRATTSASAQSKVTDLT